MGDFMEVHCSEELEQLLSDSGDECSENTDEKHHGSCEHHQPGVSLASAQLVGRRVVVWMQKSWIVMELVKQIKLAVPVILTMLLSQSVFFVSNVFVGHLDDDPINLDVPGLGFTFVNMIGVSVGVGLSTAADTLFAQTYGFKNYKRVGIVLQRAILILLLTAFPVIVLCLNSEFLLLLIKQKPCVARLAADYVKILSIAIPSIVAIFVVVGIVQNTVSVLAHPLFLYALELGVLVAAAALVLSHFLALIFLLLYIRLRGLHRKTWDGWSWSCLREWWPFLRLGLPGMLMICLEWWAFEIGTVITGVLGRTQLAVNSVLFNTLALVYMLGLGVGVAATVRVGNELGAGNPTAAKRAAYISVTLGGVVSTFSGIMFLIFRHEIGKIFTTKREVIDGIAEVCYIAGPLLFFDLLMVASSGILKGLGRQLVGAVTNFVSYYIIGIPLAVYLALYGGLEVMGVWTGLAVADFIQLTVFLLVIFCTDWKKQALKAMSNAQDKQRGSTHTLSQLEQSVSDGSIEPLPLVQHDNEQHVQIVNKPVHSDAFSIQKISTVDQHITASSQDAKPKYSALSSLKNVSTNSREILILSEDEHEGQTLTNLELCKDDSNEAKAMTLNRTPEKTRERLNMRTKLWLLASKGVWFLLGSVLVVVGGIGSHFQSNTMIASNCTNITIGNYTV